MREERCSVRQLWVCVFVSLLAPASALPAALARGGGLGWLGPVLIAPAAALAAWRFGTLGGDGLAACFGARWGRLGKALLPLYYLWTLSLSALTAGNCVDRLSHTDYLGAPDWILALALTAVAAYLIYKGPAPFLRGVEIFFLALVAVLALFFVLGAANLKGANLRPAGGAGQGGWSRGLLSTAGAAGAGALAAFLPHRLAEPGETPGWRWAVRWCLTAAGLCLLVIGTLGAPLTTQTPLPFFLTLQGLSFPGGLQRLEALGTAAWVLSDLALLGLAGLATRRIAGDRPWAILPALAAALLGGSFLTNDLSARAAPLLLGWDLLLGVALPLLLSWFPGRRTGKGEGLSCG